jgi:hypothetical protein
MSGTPEGKPSRRRLSPDERAFFAPVVRAEGERLFEATSTPARPGQSLFDRLRRHAPLDAIARVPAIAPVLADAVADR